VGNHDRPESGTPRTHQNNVHRYRRLLATRLTDLEQAYIERRLSEEQASVRTLLQDTFPDRLCVRTAHTMNHGRTTNLEMTALLHPAHAFTHPMDVVEDCDLTTYEKRAILSSWAADACAVKGVPEPGRSFQGATVSFDDILDALRVLDDELERGARTDSGTVSRRRSGPDESKDGRGEANAP